MSVLTITNLSHTFDGKILFQNANLAINNGEHTGIVGLNGAGKSTFMNIISGKLIQDDGEVRWLGSIKWGYLDQHADIDRNLTVMEYLEGAFKYLFELNEKLEGIYTEMTTETDDEKLQTLINRSSSIMDTLTKENFFEIENAIKKVANGLGVGGFGYGTKVSTLSGGQRAKLMLAQLLLSELDVILLDEPTNFLDIEHIKWLADYINSYDGTVLVISHDVEFLNTVSRNIISVENGSIKKYSGNYDKFLATSEMNASQLAEAYEKQQQQIKKLEVFIAKNKARAATAGMAKSREKVLEKMDTVNKPSVIYPAVFKFKHNGVISKDMLKVENLEVGYNGRAILPPINFNIESGTKLWIRGTNGIGKSTLLKTIMRKLSQIKGSYCFSVNSNVLYLEQDLEFINKEENAAVFLSACYPKLNISQVRTALGAVGIKNDLAIKPLKQLSGGEQVKVKLAALMQNSSNMLILDEPTNHLDVKAKESLKKALQEYEGSIILVSHERPFAEDVCNEIFDL